MTRLRRRTADLLRSGPIAAVRSAARALARRKGLFLTGFLTLALGLGLCGAIFTVLHGVLLRPLPFPEADRLVIVWGTRPNGDAEREAVSERTFLEWRRQASAFEGLAAFRYQGLTLLRGGEPAEIPAAIVSPELFSVLGARTRVGRAFTPAQAASEQGRVVLMSERIWRDRFGADPEIVGGALELEGEVHTVTGVMPAGFDVPSNEVGFWKPLLLAPQSAGSPVRNLVVIGRLRSGVRPQQAQAEMDAVARRLAAEFPDSNDGEGARIVPFFDELVRESRPLVLVLSGAALLILLICCVNLTSLAVARTIDRRHELAIRSALGAGRRDLVGVVVAESWLLVACGGVAGALLARLLTGPLIRLAPVELPRTAGLDRGMAAPVTVALLALVTGALISVLPVWYAGRREARFDVRLRAAGPARRFPRQVLVSFEIAVALILLVGSGLVGSAFLALRAEDPGWRTEGLLASQVFLPRQRYAEPHQIVQLFEGLLERLGRLPGVEAAAASSALPASTVSIDFELPVGVPGRPSAAPESAALRVVTPGYFRTMGIPLVEGREFDDRDRAPENRIVMVNRSFARRFFPGEPSVVGERVVLPLGGPAEYRVLGTVGDVRHYGMLEEPRPEVYLPFRHRPLSGMGIVVRTTGDPAAFAPTFQRELWALDPALPITYSSSMERMVASSFRSQTFLTLVLIAFATAAVGLTALGVFGVTSYLVSRQVREIGIRMAIGAREPDVLQMVVRQAMRAGSAGLVLGLWGAWLLGKWLSSLVAGVPPRDPAIFAGSVLVVAAVAWLGAYLPGRRAAAVRPMDALRAE